MTVGILTYGSLLDDPGGELQACVVQRIEGVQTPFAVEFARSSRTRDGGPTLVPVAGGASVGASILVLKDNIEEELARVLLVEEMVGKIEGFNRRVLTQPTPNSDDARSILLARLEQLLNGGAPHQ